MKNTTRLLALAALLLAPLTLAFALPAGEDKVVDEAKLIAQQIPSYPTMTCVVSDEEMGGEMGEPIDVLHEGRLVRLCCKSCKNDLAKDPAPILARIDAAIIADQGPGYPLETCAVSGQKLGSMGEPLNEIVGTRLVKLCCKGCKKKLHAEPMGYIATINAALIEKQRKSYPLDTCVVGGKQLGSMGEPVDFLYGHRLVRLCCAGCKKQVMADPQAILAKIDAAAAAK